MFEYRFIFLAEADNSTCYLTKITVFASFPRFLVESVRQSAQLNFFIPDYFGLLFVFLLFNYFHFNKITFND